MQTKSGVSELDPLSQHIARQNVTETQGALSTIQDDEEQRTTKRKWGSILDILRDVLFAYSLYLTDHEQQVLLFIFRRTRMYGKAWEKIPLRHFTEGVWSQRGGDICSRLTMKANSVATALKHLKGKGLIECREHYTQAYEYRIVEPTEIPQHDIISYVAGHQPKQMAAIVRELECNRRRLPPRYLNILEAAKSDGKAVTRSIRPGTRDIAPAATRAVPAGIDPSTNKPIPRKKKPIDNVAPAGARPGQTSFLSEARGFRIHPNPFRSTSQTHKLDAAKLALTEALQWQDERRKARVSQLDLLALQKLWHETVDLRWPDGRVKFSERAFRNLKLAIENIGFPADDMPVFIRWAVTQWDALRRTVFSFNSKPYGPKMPDPDYFVRMLPKIHAAYVRKKRLETPVSYTRPRPPPLVRTPPADPVRTEAARKRMNLPKWE